MSDKIDVDAVRRDLTALVTGNINSPNFLHDVGSQALALIDQLTAERDEWQEKLTEMELASNAAGQMIGRDYNAVLTRAEQAEAERDALQAKVDAMQGAMVEAVALADRCNDYEGAADAIASYLRPHLPAPADPLVTVLENIDTDCSQSWAETMAERIREGVAARGGSISFGGR